MRTCKHCNAPYRVSATRTDRFGNYVDEPSCACYGVVAAWRLFAAQHALDRMETALRNTREFRRPMAVERDAETERIIEEARGTL